MDTIQICHLTCLHLTVPMSTARLITPEGFLAGTAIGAVIGGIYVIREWRQQRKRRQEKPQDVNWEAYGHTLRKCIHAEREYQDRLFPESTETYEGEILMIGVFARRLRDHLRRDGGPRALCRLLATVTRAVENVTKPGTVVDREDAIAKALETAQNKGYEDVRVDELIDQADALAAAWTDGRDPDWQEHVDAMLVETMASVVGFAARHPVAFREKQHDDELP